MRRSGPAGREGGFTLLELLIALSIFAVVSLMAYEAIAALFTAEERVGAQQARLAEVERAVTLLGRDLQDIAPRPVRTAAGTLDPALALAGPDRFILTRSGWPNPADMRRSGFQRVAYSLAGPALSRTYWQTLDPAGGEEGISAVLLSGVRNFTLRVRSDGVWTENWPPAPAAGTPADPEAERIAAAALPEAVEFTMDVDGFGRVRRLVVLGPR